MDSIKIKVNKYKQRLEDLVQKDKKNQVYLKIYYTRIFYINKYILCRIICLC